MQHLLDLAQNIAHSAGRLIHTAWKNPKEIKIQEKGPRDLVTTIDRAVEAYVIAEIQQHYSQHTILSEEAGLIQGNEFTWIIDPIDGTSNFSRGIPHFAISIGIKHADEFVVGVVYDPIRNEMFTASKGQGAYLNGQRIHISNTPNLKNAIIATGFPTKCQQFFPAFLQCLTQIFPETLGIRRAGAATLDLAYVAAGRLDGYWEIDIRDWDIAAGVLLIQEAGGLISDLAGRAQFPQYGIVAAVPGVHAAMVKQFSSIWQNSLHALFEDFRKM